MVDVTKTELKQLNQKFYITPSEKKDEKPLSENVWFCEKCNHQNLISDDINSCFCIKCKFKNEVIEYMIQIKSNQRYLDQ